MSEHAASHTSHEHHGPSTLTRLIELLRPDGRDIWTVIIFSVGVGVLALASPVAVQTLVNTVALAAAQQQLLVVSLLLFICLSFAAGMLAVQAYVVEILQRRVFTRVVGRMADRLVHANGAAFDRHAGPELVNRFFDVMTVQKVVAGLLLDGAALLLQAAISMAVLAFYHPYLMIFNLFLIAIMAFLVFGLGIGAVSTSIAESRAKYEVAHWLQEVAGKPLAFKTAGGPRLAMREIDRRVTAYLLARRDHFRILLRQILFALGSQAVASTVLLSLGGWLVMSGELTLGQLVASELMVTFIVGAFIKLGKHLEGYYDLMAAMDKIGHVLDVAQEQEGAEDFPKLNGPVSLRMNDVAFQYSSGRMLFKHINLTIAAGEKVALTAPTASGKSTLADLIFGLKQPTQGHIELDGVDIRDLRLDELRTQVALIRGVEVFEGTVFDNVKMERPDVSASRVREALADVGLLEELSAMPEGMSTPLNGFGVPLSSSQLARLMIARAIAGKPRLIVIDETLDHLEIPQLEVVLATLLDPEAPWTLLVITHWPELAARFGRRLPLESHEPRQIGAVREST